MKDLLSVSSILIGGVLPCVHDVCNSWRVPVGSGGRLLRCLGDGRYHSRGLSRRQTTGGAKMKYMILMLLAFLAILFSNTGFASPNLEVTEEEEAGVIAECLRRGFK